MYQMDIACNSFIIYLNIFVKLDFLIMVPLVNKLNNFNFKDCIYFY